MMVSSALMIWKGLMVVTGSQSPIVVVLRYIFCVEENLKKRFQSFNILNFFIIFTVVVWNLLFTEVTFFF